MHAVVLKEGRDRSLLRRHPWIFDGAIHRAPLEAGIGETIEVVAADGEAIALAAWSPESQIAARVWTFDPERTVDAAFFRERLERALALRASLARPEGRAGAERVVNAESDRLPGLIVDRYADVLVCQFLSAGAELWRDEIVAHLIHLVGPASVYERSDADVRVKEGLEPRAGVLHGAEPPEFVEVLEGSCRLLVDVREGHKTGAYLDQRDNRIAFAAHAAGREVLNCFAYTGAFTLHALAAGALRVTNVESSASALALAERQTALNGHDLARLEQIEGDVFHVLRRFRDARRSFDAIVLDPPKFADAKAHVERAARGYKDVSLLALKLLRPGGVLFTFSCSGAVAPDLFQKIVADAAVDAQRDVRITRWLRQAADHPVGLSFPEGLYLKGLECIA